MAIQLKNQEAVQNFFYLKKKVVDLNIARVLLIDC